jgi:hypothetical protein
VANIITEVFLIALPFHIVWQLQVSNSHRKVPALIVFSSRILYVPFHRLWHLLTGKYSIITTAAIQLAYYLRALGSDNVQFYIWQPILCAQFVQCTNIVSTSFLYIKLLIDSLESGFLRVDDVRRREGHTGSGYKYPYGSKNKGSSGTSEGQRHRVDLSLTKSVPASRPSSTTVHAPFRSPPHSPRWPMSSEEAVDLPQWDGKSTDVIIETKSFTVETGN